jgi:hypothetical protein
MATMDQPDGVPMLDVPAVVYLLQAVAAGRYTLAEAERRATEWAVVARPVPIPGPPWPGSCPGSSPRCAPTGRSCRERYRADPDRRRRVARGDRPRR